MISAPMISAPTYQEPAELEQRRQVKPSPSAHSSRSCCPSVKSARGSISSRREQQQQLYAARSQRAQTISRATNLHLAANLRHHLPAFHYQSGKLFPPAQQQISSPYYEPVAGAASSSGTSVASTAAMLAQQQHSSNYNRKGQQQQAHQQQQQQQPNESLMSLIESQAMLNRPLCRCRVMYLGSSVPHITKNGLHGIQEPLKHLYPEEQFSGVATSSETLKGQVGGAGLQASTTIDISHLSATLGIDSWLSVWSNGLLLENVDEFGRDIKRFFAIESLHYCAAVRFFDTSTLMNNANGQQEPQSTEQYGNNNNNRNNREPLVDLTQALNSQTGPPPASSASDQNNNNIVRAAKAEVAENDLEDPSRPVAGEEEQGDSRNLGEPLDSEPAAELERRQQRRKSAIRFLPLDAPLFQCPGMLDPSHPPMFAAIMRRTTGIKVLECHAFICRRDAAANALVRCCTHAYADFLSARRLSLEFSPPGGADLAPTSRHHQVVAQSALAPNQLHSQAQAHHQQRRAASLSRRRQASPVYAEATNAVEARVQRRQSRHQSSSGSTGGASNEDNSLEASSEDNYAIISRHHHTRPPHTTNPTDAQDCQYEKSPGSGESRKRDLLQSQTGAQLASKGSSRSLFTDFMPNGRHPMAPNSDTNSPAETGSRQAGEKLSHSMDLATTAHLATCCDDAALYSVVNSARRQSKSMQNLRQTQAAGSSSGGSTASGAPAAATSLGGTNRAQRRAGRLARPPRELKGSSEASFSERSRKASSCQDIRSYAYASSLVEPTNTNMALQMAPPGTGTGKGGTGTITGTGKGERNSLAVSEIELVAPGEESARPSYSRMSGKKLASGTRRRHHHEHHHSRNRARRSDQVSLGSQIGAQSLVDKTSHHLEHSQQQQHHLAAAAAAAQYAAEQQQQAAQLAACCYPQAPTSHPLLYPPAAPLFHPHPHLPYYLAGGPVQGAYQQPVQAAGCLYGLPGGAGPVPLAAVGSIYDTIGPHRGAYLALLQRQQLQQQLHPSLYGHLTSPPGASMGPLATPSGGGQKKKGSASATLAARFRCLSPPLSLLAPQGRLAGGISKGREAEEERQASEAGSADQSKGGNQAHLGAARERLRDGQRRVGNMGEVSPSVAVVSGQPGFISSQASAGGASSRASTAAASAAKGKMSWIKRLSLTMSASSPLGSLRAYDSDSGGQAGGGPSGDPSGVQQRAAAGEAPDAECAQEPKQRRRRRSSLFSGSLTLGRRKQPARADLITSPQT